MKSLFKTLFAVAALATVISVSSCNKTCDSGYEGSDCKTELRSKFIGSWHTINETCTSGGPSTFDISVTNGGEILKINIFNVYDAGFTIVATINANNEITIASQAIGTGSISGSGSLSGNTITLTYTVSAGGLSDVCSGVTFAKI